MKMRGKNKFIVLFVFLLFFLAAGYSLYTIERHNFHVITDGEAYRSAQMDSNGLKYYVGKYHIKSIVNLRGKNPGEEWYVEELKASSESNVMHYDVSLSAYREPSRDDMQILMEIFKSAPRPVLIHCQAGADRTGLASAMWKVLVDKRPKVEAEKELSLLYGHFSLGPASAMNRFFENWLPELGLATAQNDLK